MKIRANGIDIEVEDTAQSHPATADKPVVLLIMGLGMQLIAWPPQMLQGLVDAGYRVGSASLVGISHLGAVRRPAPAVLGDAVLSSLTTIHRGRPDGRYPTFQSTDPRGTAL